VTEANHLFARSEVAHDGDTDEAIAGVRREIADARKLPDASPVDQVLLDHAEGRLLIDRDPAAGATHDADDARDAPDAPDALDALVAAAILAYQRRRRDARLTSSPIRPASRSRACRRRSVRRSISRTTAAAIG
jgi:hypothetical protein